MVNFSRYILVLIVCFTTIVIPVVSHGQDIESKVKTVGQRITDKKILLSSGSIQAGLSINHISGIERRQDPIFGSLGASLLLDLFTVKLPFSIYVAPKNKTYRLPSYSFVGVSPTYKWATFHLGDRSMNISNYAFSNHSFRGVGIELKPGKWHFKAMNGTIQRSSLEDLGFRNGLEAQYERIGRAMALAYNGSSGSYEFSIFKGEDITDQVDDSFDADAFENVVTGLKFNQNIGRVIQMDFDGAYSTMASKRADPVLALQDVFGANNVFHSFKPSDGNLAYRVGLNVKTEGRTQIGVMFEHIDNNYQSLGSLNFNNDIENVTLRVTGSIFSDKVLYNAQVGGQRNNISKMKGRQGSRIISQTQLNYRPSNLLNLSLGYSNFSNTEKYRLPTTDVLNVVLDSILLATTNQSFNFSASYSFDKKQSRSMTFTTNYNTASQIQSSQTGIDQKSRFFTIHSMYNQVWKAQKMNGSLGVQLSHNNFSMQSTLQITRVLSMSKLLLKDKWQTGITASLTNQRVDGLSANAIIVASWSNQFRLSKNSGLSFISSFTERKNKSNGRSFTDLTGRVNYRMKF